MNRTRLLAVSLLAVATSAGPVRAATYDVDPAHTNVGFTVRHILTRLPGRFREFGGTFSFDPAAPEKTTGRFTVKAASIDTNMDKRDAHLRSQDFFWVDKYPELTFVLKGLTRSKEANRFTATADLTIRGVTKSVPLDVEYLGSEKTPWGSAVASFEARGTINRKDFGLTWNKALESGGVLVGDEVQLVLDVEGTVQAPKAK